MFKIRDDHLKPFAAEAERRDTDELCNELRSIYPDRVRDIDLLAAVSEAAGLGRRHGLVSQADIRTFVTYRVILGVRVEGTPEFRSVVVDPAVDPDRRMLALALRTDAAYWRRLAAPAADGS